MKINMNMAPEEKYEAHLRYVLGKLKDATLYLVNDDIAAYRLDPRQFDHYSDLYDEEVPNYDQEVTILDQLQEQKVIEKKDEVYVNQAYGFTPQIDKRKDFKFKPIEPTFFEWYERYVRKDSQSQRSPKRVEFENWVLKYDNTRHSFHKGKTGDAKPRRLFKLLWDNRKIIQRGDIKQKGKSNPASFYATQIGMATDAGTFGKNKDIQKQFFQLIKGMGRILKSKGFPMKIESKGDIQLVITYK